MELALFLPLLVTILAGAVSFGSMFRDMQLLSDAVKVGAREASRASATRCDSLEDFAVAQVYEYLTEANRADLTEGGTSDVLEPWVDAIPRGDDKPIIVQTHAIRVAITLEYDEPMQLFAQMLNLGSVEAFTVHKLEGDCEP